MPRRRRAVPGALSVSAEMAAALELAVLAGDAEPEALLASKPAASRPPHAQFSAIASGCSRADQFEGTSRGKAGG
mgnify:CR=1 FL=1